MKRKLFVLPSNTPAEAQALLRSALFNLAKPEEITFESRTVENPRTPPKKLSFPLYNNAPVSNTDIVYIGIPVPRPEPRICFCPDQFSIRSITSQKLVEEYPNISEVLDLL